MTATARLTSRSPEETRALGEKLGALLQPGDVIGLEGDLGAGKTELVRGIALGAGVPAGEVTSPSFALVNTYDGRLTLHHVDLYRLKDADELYAMGFDDLLQSNAAVLVEWASRIPRALPAAHLRIALEQGTANDRMLTVEAHGDRAASLLNLWTRGWA